MRNHRSLTRLGLAALLGGLVTFTAARSDAACDQASLKCSLGTTSLTATLRNRLSTEIDSGWMEKSGIKIRTRFTIDPVGKDPIFSLGMDKGSMVEASWSEKGFIDLKALTAAGEQGTMTVHYQLVPSLEASLFGLNINYNASALLSRVGGSFKFDSQATGTVPPWGFAGGQVQMPAPPLDQSTIFSVAFDDLGLDPSYATGTLAIQATTKPLVKYTTKEIRFDASTITSAEGVAKIPVSDGDSIDVTAYVSGEITLEGSLDIRPVIKADSVGGYPTFGLTKYSFSAVKKPLANAPIPVVLEGTTIHVPLPNVKVPATPINVGRAKGGQKLSKSISIDSTGEMDAILTFESSDPQFVVPNGQVKVASKQKYDLNVSFDAKSDAPATATITVRSNDPDSPEQTFKVSANGAGTEDGPGEGDNGGGYFDSAGADDGCSVAHAGTPSAPGYGALGIGLGLALLAARRRR